MNTIKSIFIFVLVVIVTGCIRATPNIYLDQSSGGIEKPALFAVKATGKTVATADDGQVIEVGKIMEEYLGDYLKKKNLYLENKKQPNVNKYLISVNIEYYSPGNAAKRYLLSMGMFNQWDSGISGKASIYKLDITSDEEKIGDKVAEINFSDEVKTGSILGGIGGWKSIITSSANKIGSALYDTFFKN